MMEREEFIELIDKITDTIASAFDGTPEQQMAALELLERLRGRVDDIVRELK